MKKFLFSIVAFIALFPIANTQAQGRLGAVIGADLSTLKFDQNLFTVDQSLGYSAGIMGELNIPGIGFGINASLLYTQRGATMHLGEKEVWASQGYGNTRSYLHYIEVPINVRFKYSNLNGIENTIAPFVFAGPSFSFLAAHNKIDAISYAGMDLELHVGIGAELYNKIQVAASYGWGMTYALKTNLLDDFSAQNRTWKLTVTYFFK
ncbi:MAG: outer membrane beta-barrel protein [Muribaculaceae bacterium]|nr:outer membrane beta-barrel protein [Muribaculaceae bacterium]